MFDIVKFMELIGFGEWWERFAVNDEGALITFSDVTFGTLPFILRLVFIIFLLNWIMGMISDGVKMKFGGRF